MRYALLSSPSWATPQHSSIGYDCVRFSVDGTVMDHDCIQLVYGPVDSDDILDSMFTELLNITGVTRAVAAASESEFAQILSDNQGRVGMAVYFGNDTSHVRYSLFAPPYTEVQAYSSSGYDDVCDVCGQLRSRSSLHSKWMVARCHGNMQ